MGLPGEPQAAPDEFPRDISGLDGEGYDNYSPTEDIHRLDIGDDFCLHCNEGFKVNEKVVQARNEKYHVDCFVYVQVCFPSF